MQTRLKRSLPFGSTEQRFQKNGTVSTVRQLVQVSLPVFWHKACIKGFGKTSVSFYINIAETKHKDNHLPGGHALFREDS